MIFKQYIKNKTLQISALLFNNNDSKIIYYHDVHQPNEVFTEMSTAMELFKQHVAIVEEEGYKFVRKITSPTKELMVTFDDGFRGLYENFDYFVENKIPVKLFLISDFIGQEDYITIDEIKEMLSSGYLSIGSHTCSHEDMTLQTIDTVKKEMGESKKILEKTFEVSIDDFCFPRGFYNEEIVKVGKNIGYKRLYSSIPGSFTSSDFVVKRNLVQDVNKNNFINILNGGLELLRKRYQKQHIKVST